MARSSVGASLDAADFAAIAEQRRPLRRRGERVDELAVPRILSLGVVAKVPPAERILAAR